MLNIRKFINRILKIILSLGFIDTIYTVKYSDKFFSLNDLYSQGHWSKRSGIKKRFSKAFLSAIEKNGVKRFSMFYLVVLYNSRHDVDNISGMAKVFVDTLKGTYVPEDNKKYYKGLLMFPVSDIEHGNAEFIILSKR